MEDKREHLYSFQMYEDDVNSVPSIHIAGVNRNHLMVAPYDLIKSINISVNTSRAHVGG